MVKDGKKFCTRCNEFKPINHFNKLRRGGKKLHAQCKNCVHGVQNEYDIPLKQIVFQKYGNICVCCGETMKEALTIDHINNDGKIHRDSIKQNIYKWLRDNNFPKNNFQILCYNCNIAKFRNGGKCPHNMV